MFEIVYDARQRKCVRKELKIYENFHADETASVQEMFADMQLLAPADSYGLAIGCHGFGWIPKDAPLPQGRYVPERPLPGALITRSTRFFGDSGHLMDIAQLADAVAGLSYRFDYLIFDGCFMSNIETLYDLRHSFDYIISSPCEIMGAGFPMHGRFRICSSPMAPIWLPFVTHFGISMIPIGIPSPTMRVPAAFH